MMTREIIVVVSLCVITPAYTAERPNVVMIAVDDLNDWVGCLHGHPQVQTPHIDALAARGTLFTNAHCQAPLCNPSRTSLLFSLRPSTTGIYTLQPGPREVPVTRDAVTLFQHFAAQGYATSVFGKVFHDGSIPPKQRSREVTTWGPAPGMPKPPERLARRDWGHPAMDWGIFPEDDRQQADWQIADAAIGHLQAQTSEQPFVLAVGFRLPHVPCFASRRWFERYPLDGLTLPPVLETDRDDIPEFAWALHWRLPEPRLSALRRAGDWEPLVRAYLATTSFMDAMVGRVLSALAESPHASNTLVVLWSDHGWHLGEKGITGKNTLWERSTRVPLIFAGPGVTKGARCAEPAELLDLAPTLTALCGLPGDGAWEGLSLRPQLRDAATPRERPAVTTHNVGNHAVRSTTHRYIRYADGSEEFYDLSVDPHEWTNLAGRPEHAEAMAAHRRWLPKIEAAPVLGSAHRLLVRDGDRWLWEGEPIVWDEVER